MHGKGILYWKKCMRSFQQFDIILGLNYDLVNLQTPEGVIFLYIC